MTEKELLRANSIAVARSFECGVFCEELEDRLSDWFAVVLDVVEERGGTVAVIEHAVMRLMPEYIGVYVRTEGVVLARERADTRTMVCVGQEMRRWEIRRKDYVDPEWCPDFFAGFDIGEYGYFEFFDDAFHDWHGPCSSTFSQEERPLDDCAVYEYRESDWWEGEW